MREDQPQRCDARSSRIRYQLRERRPLNKNMNIRGSRIGVKYLQVQYLSPIPDNRKRHNPGGWQCSRPRIFIKTMKSGRTPNSATRPKPSAAGAVCSHPSRWCSTELGITRTVKNLKNGNVEIIATGTAEQLEQLTQWCNHGPPHAVVNNIKSTPLPLQPFNNFIIIRF